MKKVDEKLNNGVESHKRKLISTVPFISHFNEVNKFNLALKDISNNVDIVGVQFYNQVPSFSFKKEETGGPNDSYGICKIEGQEQFKTVLKNLDNTIGLHKTIILVDNIPETVPGNNESLQDGGMICKNQSWARSHYKNKTIKNKNDETVHLIQEATCLLGGTWDNLDTKANGTQSKSMECKSSMIRHKPLIEIPEIIRSL